MFMSTSVWAVDPPTEVEPGYTTEWATPEDGGVYFLYNVGADQYLGGGNNWGTHVVTATVSDESPTVVYYWDAGMAFSGAQTQFGVCCGVLPITLTKNEDGTFYIEHMGSNRTDCYLTSEDGNSWIDGGIGRAATFIITAVEGGYTIQPTNTVEAETYFGAQDPESEPEDGYDLVRNVMTNLTAETGHIIWRFAPTNYYECMSYEERLALYDKIVEAQAEGVNTTDAETVYNNPNATKEEIQAVISALSFEINSRKFEEYFAGASADNPMDVTEYAIENPTFDSNIDGWTITVVGQNLQWQGRTDGQVDPNQNWVSITNFIEAWRPAPTALGDGTISQTIYGLPQGKYVLECDAMATLQGGSPSPEEAVEGAFIFIQGDNNEVRSAIKAPDTQPKHWSVTFISPEGNKSTTIGLKVENTTANWISADNFKLTYYGKFEGTPEQAELQDVINKAEEALDMNAYGEYPTEKVVEEALEAALDEAKVVVVSEVSAEEYIAANEKLSAALKDYETSRAAYTKLYEFMNGDMLEYMEMAANWPDLYDELEKLQEELEDGYGNYTISAERIDEIIASFLPAIREYIKQGNINPGDDITLLMDNPGFDEGNTSNPTGWTIKSGSLTELRHSTSNIETWHKTFDICQTITDMPAGIYDITVQGFVRHDNAATSYDETIFYAGDLTTTLMTLEDQWSLEPIFQAGDDAHPTMGDSNYDSSMTTPDGEAAYKCNGMTGAYYWFQTLIPEDLYESFKYKPWDGDYYYTNHIKAYLKERGDFTIGLKTTSTTDWVIWDNFKIKFIGEDLGIYIEMVVTEFDKLKEFVESGDAFITKKAEEDYQAVSAKVDNVNNLENGDQALALISEIQAVYDYINEGTKLGNSLKSTYYLYAETMMEQVESTEPTFPALLDVIAASIQDPTKIESNDAIEPILSQLKKGWTKYVMYDNIEGASEENPKDVTAVIYNPDYSNYDLSVDQPTSSEGWTNEISNGATAYNGTYYTEIEFYNTNFNHFQTIEGLEPGWYGITNEAFYRAGDVNAMTTAYNDSVPALNSYMYAVAAGDTVSTALLHGMFDGAQVDPTGSDGEVTVDLKVDEAGNKATFYVPNLMGSAKVFLELEDEEGNFIYTNQIFAEVKEDGVLTIGVRKNDLITNDWTVISNWTLTYYGKNGLNAVESIDAKSGLKMAQFFGIDGRQQSKVQRGVNIVRMADGSVRKVLVK